MPCLPNKPQMRIRESGQAWTSWENAQGGHGLQEIYTDDRGGMGLNLNRIVAKIEDYGMDAHYHTQGDMAIDAVLNALDKVKAEKGEIRGTHTLIHLAFVTPEQLERIKGFNGHVVITTQPGFWPVENNTAVYYGERAGKAYDIRKMIDSGLSVWMSTDFSVSPFEYSPPSAVMGVALTGGGNPTEHTPLSLSEIIRGFTLGSARTTGKQDVGTLDIGKKADLVVYEKDLNLISPDKLNASYPKVLATYVSGRKAYQASGG